MPGVECDQRADLKSRWVDVHGHVPEFALVRGKRVFSLKFKHPNPHCLALELVWDLSHFPWQPGGNMLLNQEAQFHHVAKLHIEPGTIPRKSEQRLWPDTWKEESV